MLGQEPSMHCSEHCGQSHCEIPDKDRDWTIGNVWIHSCYISEMVSFLLSTIVSCQCWFSNVYMPRCLTIQPLPVSEQVYLIIFQKLFSMSPLKCDATVFRSFQLFEKIHLLVKWTLVRHNAITETIIISLWLFASTNQTSCSLHPCLWRLKKFM